MLSPHHRQPFKRDGGNYLAIFNKSPSMWLHLKTVFVFFPTIQRQVNKYSTISTVLLYKKLKKNNC